MAKKTVKKVDVKKVAKAEVSAKIREFYESLGVEVGNGVDYGFTDGTLVLKLDKCDLQVKLITPKAGVERYESLVEEEEEEVQEEESADKEEINVECKHLENCKSKDVLEICPNCIRNKLAKVTEEEHADFLDESK